MKRDGKVTVLSLTPDEHNRFPVFVNRYAERWSLDRIKEHVADGGELTESENAR